jgi:tetratricopeptide (TPR) repeat protein
MKAQMKFHNRIVAAFVLVFLAAAPAMAQTAKLDDLFMRLKTADATESKRITEDIWIEWSKSGSPAMDLLLERGRNAMMHGHPEIAIEHLTALIDHDPGFPEGWNARATAYYQTGNLGPAISDIGHVLTLNPRHFGALAGLGAIFEDLEKPKEALEAYKAALAINPHAEGVEDAIKRIETQLQGKDL